MASPGVSYKKRLLTMLVGVTFIFFVLITRLGWIQLYRGTWLQEKAVDQWTRDLPVAPKRGMIMDRNGKILAQSASAETVVIRPSQVKNADELAEKLASILEMDREEIYKKATDKSKSEIWLKRQISKEQANQIRKEKIPGVVFTEESKRYYPAKNFLAQVLGFTSIDGVGLEGLEAKYDKYLKGVPGRIVTETDSVGRELPYNVNRYVPPEDGLNLVLSIDYVIQSFVEKAMEDALVKNKAKKVEAVVMDPNNGEILAMVNKPDYDPNNPPRHDMDLLRQLARNSIVSDVYEPGSTFKIFTSAAGLDAGVVGVNETFYDPGYKIVDNDRIKCWKAGGHGSQTFVEAVKNSCNPVFMDVALRLGKEKYYDYIKAFGFGSPTGVDISGDEGGIVRPVKYVKNVDLARIGFGQSIAVTPLQMAAAVSAAINGGNLITPRLVKELRDQNGELIKRFEPNVVRRVITEETSRTMREILEGVVKDGTGHNAYIPGYRVGGKTGTAQKYDENGRILQDKHIASFVGFAPANDPKVVVLVILDEPDVPVDFGGVIAAPIVGEIMEDILKYMDIALEYTEEDKVLENEKVEVPDVIDMDFQKGVSELTELGLQYMVDGIGGRIKDQMPKPGSMVTKKTIVLLYVEEKEETDEEPGMVEVPDIIGKSIVEVNRTIISCGLKLKIEGNGVAVSQDPAPKTKVEPGTTVTVRFQVPGEEE
ncbi:MAG: stage V sporulation protein D [Clostridia bacterium]